MSLSPVYRADSAEGAPLDPSRLHPSIALAPYVEALIVGRRVAVLGDATLDLADALCARGARLCHAYDPDPARVAEAIARTAPAFGSHAAGRPAARGVVYAVLSDDLGVRDGAFDAVLIPDLTLFEDRPDAVRRAKRLVAPTGAVVIASPNPDARRRLIAPETSAPRAPSYYELFDLLSLQFPVVKMVGQAPFVGYAIVDFAPDREPDVSFDASLMAGTEEPETFVAVASERQIATDAYLVVEVPAEGVLGRAAAPSFADAGPSSARDVHRSPNDHVHLAEMQARVVLMEAEMDDLREQKGELLRQMDAARAASHEAEGRAQETTRKAGADAERYRDLEARAGDEHVRAERLGQKVRDLEEELVRQRDRAQKLTKQLDDEKRSRQKAEIELGMARGLQKPEEDADRREEELEGALSRAQAHADSLASELLAKSKETAELRRENDAAEAKIADLSRERDDAEKKVEGLTRALHAAQARVDEMEEQAQTLRRPLPIREPVVVGADLQAGMMARLTLLEGAERRAVEEATESRRAVDLLAAERNAALARVERLEIELAEERGRSADLLAAKTALEAEVRDQRRRVEELQILREDEAAPEVSHLEAALRDRGHKIAGLERDLRESERIGRELIAEIEGLRGGFGGEGGDDGGPAANGGGTRAAGPSPAPGLGAAASRASAREGGASAHGGVDPITADAFQHRIDALSADAAQKQAEILTSAWKIQALERELGEVRARASDPSLAQRELGTALARAQSEIAELRRALAVRGDPGPGVPRAAVEDAVLLHQQLGR